MDPNPTDVLTKAALERLKRATEGRVLEGFTCVQAADVIAVAASLKPDKKDGVTTALLQGAIGAGSAPEGVFQKTEYLLHLLEQAG